MPLAELRVLIADDHAPFLRTLHELLSGEEGLRIVAECSNGVEALERLKAEQPDVAVLDVEMPGMDGIAVCTKIPPGVHTRVILLTMHKEPELLQRAREAGVRGYVLKENAVVEVYAAVCAVAAGEIYAGRMCLAFGEAK